MILTRSAMRRRSAPLFIRAMSQRHPELLQVVGWPEVEAIAAREGIALRWTKMPAAQKARLVRFGEQAFIQVNSAIGRAEAAVHAVHELVHFWRDDPGVACYHSSEPGGDAPSEEFAEIVAWVLTSPAREFVDR